MSDFASEFSKYEFTPRQERLLEIQEDMRRTINDFALLFAQTWHGFTLLSSHLESERLSLLAQLAEMLPSGEAEGHYKHVSQLLVPYKAPEDLAIAPAHGTLQSFRSDTAPNSHHIQTLGSSLLVALYHYWHHTWRPGIESAVGQEVLSDFWGDVCKLRNCILHNKARADANYEKRAKILKWFRDGDAIVITSARFTTFISQARDYCESFVVEFL
ncbi:MAG TPA: hypothetical protein VFC44_08705 [Candidatus Saccharimonadales bacterium]|nr:hypothetical protein [Candidatus Saccharimonadales bacterium]